MKILKKLKIIDIHVLLLFILIIPMYSWANVGENHALTIKTYILEDPSGKLKIKDILEKHTSTFTFKKNSRHNFGYSKSSFWYKLIVENKSNKYIDCLVESQYPLLDYVTAYIPNKDKIEIHKGGDGLKFQQSTFNHHNFIVPFKAKSGQAAIYFKIRSAGPVIVKLKLWDIPSFFSNSKTRISLIWLFYGIMITLLIYNIFIYITMKDSSFLALSCFIFSTFAMSFSYSGMGHQYIWPEHPGWSAYNHSFFLIVSIISILIFSQLYLNTEENLPFIHKILNKIITIAVPSAIFISALPISYSIKFSELLAVSTTVILIIAVMIPMFRINKRQAAYFSTSWFLFTLSIVIMSLRNYGIIDETIITTWGYQILFASGILILSLSVSDKINIRQYTNKTVLKTLKESEKRYRLFFETAHDGIMYIIEGLPVYANKKMIKMTGYNENEFYSNTVNSLFSKNSDSSNDIDINEILKEQNIQKQFEAVLRSKNGQQLDVLVSVSSLKTGMSNGFFMIITDISLVKDATKTIQDQYSKIQSQFKRLSILNDELFETQENLVIANRETEKEKEYLSAVLSSIGDGVIACNMAGEISLMNKISEDLTGATLENAIGKNISNVIKLKDKRSDWIISNSVRSASRDHDNTQISIPFDIIDGNDKILTIELKSSTIKYESTPVGIVFALRDITIKNKIDNEISKMTKLESIGILAGGIAHDFNNLLTGISGNISIATNRENIDNETRESLAEIANATNRATGLTKQLLTFAKGGDPLIAPSSIGDIIRESAKFIIKNPDIKCSIEIQKDIHAVMIDSNQMSQAINNLIINSVQAMPNGGKISIKAENLNSIPQDIPLKNGEYVLLRIKDSGNGISNKDLNKIFDPFFTTKKTGTGLGLSSTYSIIKKHKGFIKVNSKSNSGTTFYVYLKKAESLPYKPEEKEITKIENKSGKVLIMDDEEYIRNVAIKMLKHLNYEVESASTGEEAIEMYKNSILEESPYAIAILDLNVQNGMGGKNTIKELLKINPQIKSIVCSGYSDSPIMANFTEYGFSGMLKKPYTMNDIVTAIESII